MRVGNFLLFSQRAIPKLLNIHFTPNILASFEGFQPLKYQTPHKLYIPKAANFYSFYSLKSNPK